jgi:molecular chaperone IbpA
MSQTITRHTIGYENLLSANDSGTYPPHNIDRFNDRHYRLTLAVAGFTYDDIVVTVDNGFLNIEGTSPKVLTVFATVDAPTALYQGISARSFKRYFKIGPDVEVKQALLNHGLLVIDMYRVLPENGGQIRIPVNYA